MKLFYSIFILLFFILLLFFPLFVRGIYLKEVFINEIAWMGSEISANDEWIEFYNTTENNINLDGWVLKADDGTPEINLTGIIPAKGFYLLERTDDETVPGISADLIYKGALGNNGENLKLYDNLGNLINEVNCKDGWLAGDNGAKLTMERTESGWQDSQEPGGTPKRENYKNNNVGVGFPDPEINKGGETPALQTKPIEDGPLQVYPAGVIFNEILPSPEGPDEAEEWIEIYNQNNFEVDLSGWQIRDIVGSVKTYTFPSGSKISPLEYLVLKRPETKITLNNSGDGLELLNPKGEIVDSITFEKAALGQSYNRTESGWVWSTILTPGKANILPLPEPPEQKTQTKEEPASSRSMRDSAGKATAALGEKTINLLAEQSNNRSLLSLLIAFTIAIFSAGIILFLKKTIKN